MLHSLFSLKTTLKVSGGISTHHQEHTQLYLQHLEFVKPYCYLPLSWKIWNSKNSNSWSSNSWSSKTSTIAAGSSTVWQVPNAVDTVLCATDDGWRYHPKYLEPFPEINKRCNVASCWTYIRIYLRYTDP